MISTTLALTLTDKSGATPVAMEVRQAVIAGWTGRDPVARDKHIAELEALGVPRPGSTPIFYRVAAARITSADSLQASGDESSGEVEFVLFRHAGTTYVGVGSDHTDRKVETYNITVSKQMCDKPVAAEVWPLDEVIDHWDALILRAYATIEGTRVLYQEGTLDGMLPVETLVARGFDDGMPDGCVMFGGTFAAKGGIRPASRFDYEIEDPVLKRTISHGYEIVPLPFWGDAADHPDGAQRP